MRIFIDADGCPVVDEAIRLAKVKNVEVIILCDTSHVFHKDGVQTITVSKGADSVDFALVNRLSPGDIAVTQDYGLAAMCLAKRAVPISQNGLVYNDDNIGALLLARHTAKKIRNAGGRLKGPAKRTPEQDAAFCQTLSRLLEHAGETGGQGMKVLLCAVNAKYVHSSLAPWYLRAAVLEKDANADIAVKEFSINQLDASILEEIYAAQPDVLAFCCYIWNIAVIKRLLPVLKVILPRCKIILGGPEVSFNAPQVLAETQADAVICGEGEVSFPRLLRRLEKHEPYSGIAGLCCRDAQGEFVLNPQAPCAEVPPSPYCEEYFQNLKGRIAYLETSRGCPFSCAFCLSGQEGGVRFFPMERAKRELLLLANSGAKTVKLVDRTFNCNEKRAEEIFRFLIEHRGNTFPDDVCFHFEVGADLFHDNTIALLNTAPAGLFQIEAGIQSFAPQTLAAVSRKTDVERLEENLRQLIALQNIHVHVDLIAGLPHEDLQSFGDSFNRAFALLPHALQLGFLKLLHGSSLRDHAEELGLRFSPHPPYEIVESDALSYADIITLRRAEDALERLYNSGRFRKTLCYVLAHSGSTPFELFCSFGAYAHENGADTGVSLDKYAELAFAFFSGLAGVKTELLRDRMVQDRLSTDNRGRLPSCLHRRDNRLKQAALAITDPAFAMRFPYAKHWAELHRAGKLGLAVLYGGEEERIFVAEYENKHPVTGLYPFYELPFSEVVK